MIKNYKILLCVLSMYSNFLFSMEANNKEYYYKKVSESYGNELINLIKELQWIKLNYQKAQDNLKTALEEIEGLKIENQNLEETVFTLNNQLDNLKNVYKSQQVQYEENSKNNFILYESLTNRNQLMQNELDLLKKEIELLCVAFKKNE